MRLLRFMRSGVRVPRLRVAIVVGGILGATGALNWLFGIAITQAATLVASTATAVGVFLAFLTFRETHEWNRRHYTVDFFSDWNESARKHLTVLEEEFPVFFAVPDFISPTHLMDSWRLDQDRAKQLVEVKDGSHQASGSNELDIRGHLLELLNYFESVATAYEQHVVDRQVVEDSVAPVILDVCVYFQPFINEMRRINRRDPWPPLSRVVELWLTEAKRRQAQVEASTATQRHMDALLKYESKLKQPTGI